MHTQRRKRRSHFGYSSYVVTAHAHRCATEEVAPAAPSRSQLHGEYRDKRLRVTIYSDSHAHLDFHKNSKNYLVQFLANDKTALDAKMALERIRQSGRRVRGRGRAERRIECVYMPHPHSALDVLVLLDYSTTIFLPTRFEVADGARPCSCQTEHTRRYT